MKIITSSNCEIKIKNTKKPKMRNVNGRTWDVEIAKMDGKEKHLYLDTTWGSRFYVENDGKWYSGEVWDLEKIGYHEEIKISR